MKKEPGDHLREGRYALPPMTASSVARHRTAINRTEPSRPVRIALADGLISQQTSVFDYGCGRGDDLRLLQTRGIRCAGWDRPWAANLIGMINDLPSP